MYYMHKGTLLFLYFPFMLFLFTFAVQIKLRRLYLVKMLQQIHARELRKQFVLSYHCDKINFQENNSFFFF